MVYSAEAFDNPGRPRFTKVMAPDQAWALRTVLAVYKTTPTRTLELDAYCPPLNIYLNKRAADFDLKRQVQLIGLDHTLNHYVEARLGTRRPRRDRQKKLERIY